MTLSGSTTPPEAQQRDLLALYWEARRVFDHPVTCDCCWCQVLDRAHRLATGDAVAATRRDARPPLLQ